jgi:hypothetical protein
LTIEIFYEAEIFPQEEEERRLSHMLSNHNQSEESEY